MENKEIKNEQNSGFKESPGTGALSAILFGIITTIILTIIAHFVH